MGGPFVEPLAAVHLELLDGVVEPPALHFSSVKIVSLLGHGVPEGADLLLRLPEGSLQASQGRILHGKFHLEEHVGCNIIKRENQSRKFPAPPETHAPNQAKLTA